jgi:predicted transcriptional regulator
MNSKRIAHNMMVGISSDILKKVRKSLTDSFDKTPRQLERHLKGVANHRRIQILILVARNKEITLDEIAGALDCNFKTIAEHTSRLTRAGLVNKKYIGRNVGHSLSPYGKSFYTFLKSF